MTRRAALWAAVWAALLGPAAAAQPPRVANAGPPSVAVRSPAPLGPADTADPVPDTTAPWRYYPLAVGDVREYDVAGGYLLRTRVVSDTTALGHRYFVRESESTYGSGAVTTSLPVRFDTASATVRELTAASTEVPGALDCPFDAPFGSVVDCELSGPNSVEGRYDGALVFGGVVAGTGTDTVRTAVKEFETTAGFYGGYAADVGLVYSGGEGTYRALRYARVGGVEYGSPRSPTAPEPAGPEAATSDLRVWPNPARARATVTLAVAAPGPVRVVVVDGLGREVAVVHDGPVGAGEHGWPVAVGALPAGVYLVRAGVGGPRGGAVDPRPLTVVR